MLLQYLFAHTRSAADAEDSSARVLSSLRGSRFQNQKTGLDVGVEVGSFLMEKSNKEVMETLHFHTLHKDDA